MSIESIKQHKRESKAHRAAWNLGGWTDGAVPTKQPMEAIMSISNLAEKIEETQKIKVSEVVFREDLYPRLKGDAATVQTYAESIDVLPPIEVNQHLELIDGWHRWTAHRKLEKEFIEVEITETQSDAHLLELAIGRNATHGLQLSMDDKKDMAKRIYAVDPNKEKKESLIKLLSVGKSTMDRWLSDIDSAEREKKDQRIYEMYLQCFGHEEIAESVKLERSTISKKIDNYVKNPQLRKNHKSHDSDGSFQQPLYNVWTFSKLFNETKHFGNTEQRIVDNLIYLYTNPLDIVIDPFAGGGSTLDVCLKRGRRCFISDRKPIVEREKEIRKHDLTTDGLPKPPNWKDVKLVYLDPPYWKQAEKQYSDDPTDLANMNLEDFNKTLAGIINGFAKKLTDAHIALIIQPTQWKSPGKEFTDHVSDMISLVKAKVKTRISAPYSTEQYNAQQVNWAKENKELLVISREIIVWRI